MSNTSPLPQKAYFPAVVCAEFDSPIDALVSLCVPLDEATTLVTASWQDDRRRPLVVTLDVGRSVAALMTDDGRWAACHAYLEHLTTNEQEALRQLGKLCKRGKRGMIGFACMSAALMRDITPVFRRYPDR